MSDPTRDAFGRSRVSNPTGLFDSHLRYDDEPLLWEEVTAGGGASTHIAARAEVRMRVLANGDSVVRQTRAYFRYQPGKSQLIHLTGILGPSRAGIRQRVGYFDAWNGVFFEQTADGLFVVKRDALTGTTADHRVTQADWNLDALDGTGASGVTLIPERTQIFTVDLQWLGVGRVRMGVVVAGVLVYCHEFLHANVADTPYMTTANLPLRYEIAGVSTAAVQTDMYQVCCSVSSEGGFEAQFGTPFSAGNGTTTISVNARRPVLSIRPKSLFNGLQNRRQIVMETFGVYSDDQALFYEIVYGGTLTGANFADADAAYSAMERDVSATAISGGIVVQCGYVAAASRGANQFPGVGSASLLSKLPLSLNIAGGHPTSPLSDVLTLVGTTLPDAASDVAAAFNWRELT